MLPPPLWLLHCRPWLVEDVHQSGARQTAPFRGSQGVLQHAVHDNDVGSLPVNLCEDGIRERNPGEDLDHELVLVLEGTAFRIVPLQFLREGAES